ncbi:MAG: hypothetical protein RBT34_05095 [Anaerolineaceae bacterium]|jgi:hypothetical protein|nr:hypothetical protein [Anaerolineaceae bacterium]
MNEFLTMINNENLMGRLLTTIIGLVVIFFLVRLAHKAITQYIQDGQSRSFLRKLSSTLLPEATSPKQKKIGTKYCTNTISRKLPLHP